MSVDFAPHNMTNDLTPFPYVSTASTTWSSQTSYMAFNGTWGGGGYWLTNGVSSGWLQLDIGINELWKLENYSIRVNTIPEPNRAPKDWTMKGSFNGVNWDILDTVTNQTSWGSGEIRNFICDITSGYYRFFRIDISANNGDSYLQIGELYLYGDKGNSPAYYLKERTRNRFSFVGYSSGSNVYDFAPHNMTTDSLPAPYVASASTYYSEDFYAHHAFEGAWSNNQYWLASTSTGWLKIDLGNTKLFQLNNYGVRINTIPEPNRAPKNWTLEGSTDDNNWNILSTVTNQMSWYSGEIRNFACDIISEYYRYFKINVTLNNGDTYLQVAELYLYGISKDVPYSYLKRRNRNRIDFSIYSS